MINQYLNKKHYELGASVLISIICLAFSILFPINNSIQGYTKNIFFLLVIPLLFILFILKKRPSDFGFGLGSVRAGLIWGFIGLILSLVFFYVLFTYTNFKTGYLPFVLNAPNFGVFLFYELILVNILLFLYNAFFRGFLLFTLFPFLGYWAVAATTLIYAASSYLMGNEWWLTVPHLVLGFVGGAVAAKSRSFFWAYLMSLLTIILLDAFFVRQFYVR